VPFQTATFAATDNVRLLYSITPVRIYSDYESAEFVTSMTDEILLLGKKRIDEILIRTRDQFRQRLKFNYDPSGLAVNHPYSVPEKGLLKLNSISTIGSDGSQLPLIDFEYTSNPVIEMATFEDARSKAYEYTGMLNHDFYGYYASTSILERHPFVYPEGQSRVGGPSSPEAEAWSVDKVTYGNGKVDEYEYEPNEVVAISTGDAVATSDSPLRCGIRVKRRIERSGVEGGVVTTDYTYGEGYAQHSYALDDGVQELYAWLNAGDFAEIRNILVLAGIDASYGFCKRELPGNGNVITYFLNPTSTVRKYSGGGTLALNDVRTATGGVNSLEHYRGEIRRIDVFSETNSTEPIASTNYEYAIEYKLKEYVTPRVTAVPMPSCAVGDEHTESSPEEASNLNQSMFIGFLRRTAVADCRDRVAVRSEIVAYNEENGLPAITRKTNSDGRQKLTRTSYAFEEKKPDNSLAYAGMKDKHMLSSVSETVIYEKNADDNSTDVLPADVRKANAITYSKELGSGAWSPWRLYSWKVSMNSLGVPDPSRPFSEFVHHDDAVNPNWLLTETVDRYDICGNVLQLRRATMAPQTSVMRNDLGLPIGEARGATIGETGVFTGDYRAQAHAGYWDRYNGWEKGSTHTVELVGGQHAHFGEKAVHVVRDYAAGRNNRVYPGKAYTMSAWVKVTSGTIRMATDFRYAKAGHESDWPIAARDLAVVTTPPAIWATPISAQDCSGEWRLMTMKIPASVTSQLDATKTWFARAWVGGDPAGPTFEAYVDDVRFYPSDALVVTIYYSKKWREPIAKVDENDNPGNRVLFDEFRRRIEWYKVDKTNPANRLVLTRKEYHLAGEN